MPDPHGYTTIRIPEDDHRQAREVKEKLGMTWRRFLRVAADQLDPDIDGR